MDLYKIDVTSNSFIHQQDENIEEEEINDISPLINQIDDKINIFKETVDETDPNFQASLLFIKRATDNTEFVDVLGQKMKDSYEVIIIHITNFLNQRSQQLYLNILAFNILNNLISASPNPREKYFSVTEPLLIQLYGIYDYFLDQFFIMPSEDYYPMLVECLKLMCNFYELINFIFDKDFNNMPDGYQEFFIKFVKNIKKIITLQNLNTDVLRITFISSSCLLQQNFQIYKYFVQEGFVDLCFQFMINLSPAFPEVANLLHWIAINDEPTINLFPKNYPEILKSFLIDKPDIITESTIHFINEISISTPFAQKMIETPGFLDILLSLNQSFQIQSSSLELFHSLVNYRFIYIEPYLKKLQSFDIFFDIMDTLNPLIVRYVLKIICSITQRVSGLAKIPDYYNNLIQSRELIDRIEEFTDDEDEINSELACLALSQIKYINEEK